MKLKLDENGNVVVVDGKPVYIHDDGKEIPFDAPQAMQKISSLNAENKQHREAKEKAEAELKKFDGIEDVAKAKEALKTVENLDAKKLIDAGEAEKVRQEVIKGYEQKLADAKALAEKVQGQLHTELIGGSFARSKFVTEKLAMPVDVAQAFFGKHFSIDENGAILAKDAFGNEIFSRVKPGQRADFEEALEALVDAYPNKNSILKSTGSSGGGGGAGGSSATKPKSLSECKTDVEATTSLYTRSARALKDYGYAQKDILQFTETMNKAMAIGGVSAEAQASALFQLSQALGSGQLQGDEFKTIAESAPIILDVLAEYMGKSRAEVKKLASEEQLTSKLIFDAFNGSTEKINQKFEQMPISFGGAMQQMENAFMKFVDEQNRTLGIIENLAAGNGAKFISTLVLARVETHRQAQASLIAAKATQTQAAAELAAAQAKMNLLNSEMQLVRTKKARAAIEAKMAQQAQVITGLINAEAAAMNNLAAASQRASIASSAAAGAKNLLSGALGLIGGPMGAATIAAGALFYFSQKAQEAKEAALDTESANNRLKESYDGLSESALTLKIFEQIQAMENYGEQISKVQAEISQIQTSAWQFGLELSESSKQDLEKLNAELEKIRENKNIDLSVLTNQLTALGEVFLSNGKSIDDFRTKMKNLGVDANTADSVIAGLSNTIKQQKEAAQGGVKSNLELDEAFKKLKERTLTVAQNLEVAKLKQQGQAESAFVLAGLYELLGDKGAEYNQVLINIANGTITAANAADKGIDLSIETLNKLIEGRKVLQGMFKDQTQTEGINQGLNSGSGGGENARDSWLQFYDEVRKHSRSTLEEIDAEQQRMFQRLEEHNKKGVVSHEEYESAKLAISQRFANERAKLAEQFAPELQYARELKEHLQDIQQLNTAELLTHDQAKKATENATWEAGNKQAQLAGQNAVSEYDRWKAEFDPMQAMKNEQATKLAENQSRYDQMLISHEDFLKRKNQLEEQYRSKTILEDLSNYSAGLQNLGGAFGQMADLAAQSMGKQSGVYKTMFAMSKAFAVADSMVRLQQAIVQAMGENSDDTSSKICKYGCGGFGWDECYFSTDKYQFERYGSLRY
ncbi:tape measure protein [Glaesserella parasuis]|nr:tape measure protein [Glaesserella parasuis]